MGGSVSSTASVHDSGKLSRISRKPRSSSAIVSTLESCASTTRSNTARTWRAVAIRTRSAVESVRTVEGAETDVVCDGDKSESFRLSGSSVSTIQGRVNFCSDLVRSRLESAAVHQRGNTGLETHSA